MNSTCDEEGSWLLPDVSTSAAEVSRFWNSTWLSWEAVSRFWNSTWLSWEAGGGKWTDSAKAVAENSPALAGVLVATGTLWLFTSWGSCHYNEFKSDSYGTNVS